MLQGGGGSGGAAGGLKFTVADTCERIKEEFNFIQQQNHSWVFLFSLTLLVLVLSLSLSRLLFVFLSAPPPPNSPFQFSRLFIPSVSRSRFSKIHDYWRRCLPRLSSAHLSSPFLLRPAAPCFEVVSEPTPLTLLHADRFEVSYPREESWNCLLTTSSPLPAPNNASNVSNARGLQSQTGYADNRTISSWKSNAKIRTEFAANLQWLTNVYFDAYQRTFSRICYACRIKHFETLFNTVTRLKSNDYIDKNWKQRRNVHRSYEMFTTCYIYIW